MEEHLKKAINIRNTDYSNSRRDTKFYDITLKESDRTFFDVDFYDEDTREMIKSQENFIEGFQVADEDSKNKIDPEEEKRIFANKLKMEFEDGFKRGFDEGVKTGSEKIVAPIIALNQALGGVVKLHEDTLRSSEEQLLGLAVAIAEKLVRARIDTDSLSILKNTLNDAIGGLKLDTEMTVFLNPEDFLKINQAGETYIQTIKENERLVFKEDPEIPKGSCILNTNNIEVRSIIEEQFKDMIKELKQNLMNNPNTLS